MGRRLRRLAVWMAAVAFAVVACGGDSESEPIPTDGTGPAAASTAPVTVSDPCAGPLPTSLFELDAAASIATLDAAGEAATLGADGAAAALAELVTFEDTICGLDVSPGVGQALDTIRTAADVGDRDEVRRLLEELIRVDLQAVAPGVSFFRGGGGGGFPQAVRDKMGAAAAAYAQGEDDLGDEAMEEAIEEFAEYAEAAIESGTDGKSLLAIAAQAQLLGLDDLAQEAMDKATTVFEGDLGEALAAADDIKTLLAIAAQAQLLGLDDLAQEAIDKAAEIAEREMEAVAAGYEPCTAGVEETNALAAATAWVQVLGGDSSSGDVLLAEHIDIAVRRANGEAIPECEAMAFVAESPVPGWDGLITVEAHTCNGLIWEGTLAVQATLDAGGGLLAMVGSGTMSAIIDPDADTGTGPITFSRTVTMDTGAGVGTHTGDATGTFTLTVDRNARAVSADVLLDESTATIVVSVDDRTVTLPTMPVAAMQSTFDAPLEVNPACD